MGRGRTSVAAGERRGAGAGTIDFLERGEGRSGCSPAPASRMLRAGYGALGWLCVAAGALGMLLPLLPTVPFLLLAAFLFSKASPAMEARILRHPAFGPAIRAWRAERSIGAKGKRAAIVLLAVGALGGLLTLSPPWRYVPLAVSVAAGAWILTRRTAREES